jgi:hypothetical protein
MSEKKAKLISLIKEQMALIGQDMSDDSIEDLIDRVAESMTHEFVYGSLLDPPKLLPPEIVLSDPPKTVRGFQIRHTDMKPVNVKFTPVRYRTDIVRIRNGTATKD